MPSALQTGGADEGKCFGEDVSDADCGGSFTADPLYDFYRVKTHTKVKEDVRRRPALCKDSSSYIVVRHSQSTLQQQAVPDY